MSKAFTREDDQPDVAAVPVPRSALPPGAKNYLTPDGAQRLRDELNRLSELARAEQSNRGDAADPRQRALVAQQILRLQQSLASAVIVPAPSEPDDRVRFGSTVKVRDRKGGESSYRIVGVDETDMDRGWVSWLSPIAKALLKARIGQRVKFRFPSGEEELEIVSIRYE
jgi:transcription elongation factor GreB